MNYFRRFKKRKSLVFIIAIALQCITISALAQSLRKNDMSLWLWPQFEKKIAKNQYLSFQYQVRFDHNMSTFNRSNFYFSYDLNFLKRFELECLYQLNTNYHADQHTFFGGLTLKQPLSHHFTMYFRSAVQTVRNYFTGNRLADNPYTEWRNRIRLNYKINSLLAISVSGEPYLEFKGERKAYVSRIRMVAQFNYKMNRYQNFSLFYIVEPDVIHTGRASTDFVLGLVYSFRIPDKFKAFKKIFKVKGFSKENGNDDSLMKDSFN